MFLGDRDAFVNTILFCYYSPRAGRAPVALNIRMNASDSGGGRSCSRLWTAVCEVVWWVQEHA